jgi:hypothetical protein
MSCFGNRCFMMNSWDWFHQSSMCGIFSSILIVGSYSILMYLFFKSSMSFHSS